MTAILDAIRRLEAAHERGEIDEDEYHDVRRSVMNIVEDAEEVDLDAPEYDTDIITDEPPYSEVAQIALLAGLGFITCMGLATWFIGDVMAAFTVSLGLFTAATIGVAHRMGLIEEPLNEFFARSDDDEEEDGADPQDADDEVLLDDSLPENRARG
ncbi:hypothetical protein AIOL_000331 [Candidatus Rhodobacter oscarellae]|uniref:SHOCT domain-containing protein n=1 Tax=Candidatus Rhodobacter oscarellae TaxID=1675527 RepID=A0A0J9H3G3_9RHOB|nr:hypothetical protein [Candidatus Rhodobacter lobularis]KMW60178.1 hypothetical protein AIOL_000331 [Candidatus Rhodobacter lobularis]